MSVVVNIKQNPKKIKKIGLKFLRGWADANNLYFGVPNQAYVIDEYKGEEDIRNQLFVLYNRDKFGRGMGFTVQDNYDVEMVLNYPATKIDIESFYQFINNYCKNFNYDSFVLEGDTYTLDQIENLKNEAISFNQNIFKDNIKAGLTIFGCIYPIALENEIINRLKKLDGKNALQLFEDYLDEKQKNDCYFAKPLLYKYGETKLIARYALTEDVPSIFPINSYLPFGYDQNLKEDIIEWRVALVRDYNGKLTVTEEISYNDFCNLIDIKKCKKFDDRHIIITFDNNLMIKLENYKIEQSKCELENWLSDPNELGFKPYKIEYTNSFEDGDGIKCKIFKYKKSMLSKWLLGIVSDSGTFSEMKEYKQVTEIEDAKLLIETLKKYWKEMAKKLK